MTEEKKLFGIPARTIHMGTKGLLSLFLLMNIGMYVFQTPFVSEAFETLGYPTYLVYPLAAAKFFGLLALWLSVPQVLRIFAYAGFTYNFILAAIAHIAISDGEFAPALVALTLLCGAFFTRESAA